MALPVVVGVVGRVVAQTALKQGAKVVASNVGKRVGEVAVKRFGEAAVKKLGDEGARHVVRHVAERTTERVVSRGIETSATAAGQQLLSRARRSEAARLSSYQGS